MSEDIFPASAFKIYVQIVKNYFWKLKSCNFARFIGFSVTQTLSFWDNASLEFRNAALGQFVKKITIAKHFTNDFINITMKDPTTKLDIFNLILA